MKIRVKVIPKSSQNLVETEQDGSLRVKLTSAAEKGKANKQLIEILAEHFSISRSKVKILKGAASKNKLIEVMPDD